MDEHRTSFGEGSPFTTHPPRAALTIGPSATTNLAEECTVEICIERAPWTDDALPYFDAVKVHAVASSTVARQAPVLGAVALPWEAAPPRQPSHTTRTEPTLVDCPCCGRSHLSMQQYRPCAICRLNAVDAPFAVAATAAEPTTRVRRRHVPRGPAYAIENVSFASDSNRVY